MDQNFQWTPPEKTDIKRTWAKHWPEQNRDEVWKRIARSVELDEQENQEKSNG